MNFFQFFIWGSWLLTIGAYWFQTKHWSGTEFGAIFSTMGIASLFMPAIAGIIADRWLNAEKLYGIFHLCAAVILFMVPRVNDPSTMFWIMLVNMIFYMPTIALSITVGYSTLKSKGLDIVTEYPPIRVWGTIGFVVALWVISLLHLARQLCQGTGNPGHLLHQQHLRPYRRREKQHTRKRFQKNGQAHDVT